MWKFTTYLITNKVSGGRYVGVTGRELSTRLWEHRHAAKLNSPLPLHRGIRQYGWDTFQVDVLCLSIDKASMLESEVILISELLPEYNITSGGESTLGIKLSPETRAKMSFAKKGKPKSEETKQRMREAWTRRTPEFRAALAASNRARALDPVIAAKISASHANRGPEYRAKLSAAHLGRKHSPEHRANNKAAQQRRFRKEVLDV